jgi:hypothetical protein
MYSRTSSALKPEWGNMATQYEKIHVPAGTTVYVGKAEDQTISEHDHAMVGGADQVIIAQDDFEPEMVTEKGIKLGYHSGYGDWEKSIKEETAMPNSHDRYQDGANPSSTHIRDMLSDMGHEASPPHEPERYADSENPSATHIRDMLSSEENDQPVAESESETENEGEDESEDDDEDED